PPRAGGAAGVPFGTPEAGDAEVFKSEHLTPASRSTWLLLTPSLSAIRRRLHPAARDAPEWPTSAVFAGVKGITFAGAGDGGRCQVFDTPPPRARGSTATSAKFAEV